MSLKSVLISAYLSRNARTLERNWAALRGEGRRLWYVHQPDDPYSLLLAQVLPGLCREAGLPLRCTILPEPPAAYAPDAARLRAWALSDARWLSQRYKLRYPENASRPSAEAIRRAQALSLKTDDPAALADISFALLSGDALPAGEPDVGALAAGQAAVHRAGHYQGAMIRYCGEWFWGIDRLPFLLDALRAQGHAVSDPLPAPAMLSRSRGGELEFFGSFRSPYTYLATDRAIALAAEEGLRLRVRPVLPMVMRGLRVPLSKRLYIVRDCKRIADRLGIPFGNLADPLGVGVERCIAVAVAAERVGKAAAWMSSATRGIWSEGVDVASDRGLLSLAERAGLSEALVRSALGDDGWRAVAEENRLAMLGLGLWGVPTFRSGDIAAWGQDRLELFRS